MEGPLSPTQSLGDAPRATGYVIPPAKLVGSEPGLRPGVYLTPRQLAHELKASIKALETWRLNGTGPKFIRISARKVLYAGDEVLLWLKNREVNSTSEPRRAGR